MKKIDLILDEIEHARTSDSLDWDTGYTTGICGDPLEPIPFWVDSAEQYLLGFYQAKADLVALDDTLKI